MRRRYTEIPSVASHTGRHHVPADCDPSVSSTIARTPMGRAVTMALLWTISVLALLGLAVVIKSPFVLMYLTESSERCSKSSQHDHAAPQAQTTNGLVILPVEH